MRLVLKRRIDWVQRVRLVTGSGTMVGPLLRDAAAWCGRILTNRWVLVAIIALTLSVATLSCLASPQHPLKLTPCYWDVAQLPGRLALELLQAVARSMVRVAAELMR